MCIPNFSTNLTKLIMEKGLNSTFYTIIKLYLPFKHKDIFTTKLDENAAA